MSCLNAESLFFLTERNEEEDSQTLFSGSIGKHLPQQEMI